MDKHPLLDLLLSYLLSISVICSQISTLFLNISCIAARFSQLFLRNLESHCTSQARKPLILKLEYFYSRSYLDYYYLDSKDLVFELINQFNLSFYLNYINSYSNCHILIDLCFLNFSSTMECLLKQSQLVWVLCVDVRCCSNCFIFDSLWHFQDASVLFRVNANGYCRC